MNSNIIFFIITRRSGKQFNDKSLTMLCNNNFSEGTIYLD